MQSMKTAKTSLILLGALAAAPLVFSSCATRAGTAVAGAATYAAVDNRRDEQKKEDFVREQQEQRDSR